MTDNVTPKKTRRKRRSKAEVTAEKAMAELQQVEEVNPPTPENEYQDLEKVTEPEPEPVVEETPIPEPLIVIPLTGVLEIETPEPVVEEVIPEPVVEVVKVVPPSKPVQAPASPITYANPNGEYIANSFKRRRALRRGKR